jgi:hypothetical protein
MLIYYIIERKLMSKEGFVVALSEMRRWHKAIENAGQTCDSFSFTREKKRYTVFLDIKDSPYKLIICQHNTSLYCSMDVCRGYRIYVKDYYNELRELLGIEYGMIKKFLPSDFLNELRSKFPDKYASEPRQLSLIARTFSVEDPDKIYIYGSINWDKITGNTKKRTAKNLEKTRLLYPDVYEAIKDSNISIIYTSEKKEGKTEESFLKDLKRK